MLTQLTDESEQLRHIGRTAPFETIAQLLVGALLIARLHRLDEQPRMIDHAFPRGARGGLVMLEPDL